METLSVAEARRIALAAQGLARGRPRGAIGRAHLAGTVARTGLLQIDSVNVLTRAHYLPLFSRLGSYATGLLERAAWGKTRTLFEYWAHEASLLPLDLQPLLRWRMARAERGETTWGQVKPFAGPRRPEAMALLKRIEAEGPVAASDLDGAKGEGGWWGWSDGKCALEWLFWAGHITTATRRPSFERVYDLTARVLPREILETPTPPPAEAHRQLIRLAIRSLGVATAGDLRDYYRQSPEDFRPALATLVEGGELTPVEVRGWSKAAYLDPAAVLPRKAMGRALLAPFDPLIWRRERAERLFGLRYRIEIYTPAAKRVHGYYVLPFLLGDRIVARVDLKADRAGGALKVQNTHAEPGAPAATAEALAAELRLMAGWLGLERVQVVGPGDLAAALAEALSLGHGVGA